MQQGLDSRSEPPSPGSRAWAGLDEPRVGARPQSGCAGSTEGRKPSWPPATLQPHNGVILPGHRMPFVARQPAVQPRAGGGSEAAGGCITRPSALLLSGRQVGGPQSLPPRGLRSNQHCPHQAAGAEAARAALSRTCCPHTACSVAAGGQAGPGQEAGGALTWAHGNPAAHSRPGTGCGAGSGPRRPGSSGRTPTEGPGTPTHADQADGPAAAPSPAPQASPAHPTIMHPSARSALST